MKKRLNQTIMIYTLFFILYISVFLNCPDLSPKSDSLIGKTLSDKNGLNITGLKKKVVYNEYEEISNNFFPPKSSSFDPHPGEAHIREGYAILCGVSDYPGSDNDLQYCDDDVNDLYSFVQSEFCIPEENIIRLIDSESTKDGIAQAINNVSNVMDENDMLFFFYSGHGSAGISKNLYGWNIQSSHPYSNYEDQYWHYSAPGAVIMRVHFTQINVEYGYDYIFVGDNDRRSECWDYFSGDYPNVWSNWVMCDDIYVNLWSDNIVTDWGFRVDKVEVGYWGPPYNIIPYDGLDDGLNGSELDIMFDQIPGTSAVVIDSCHSGGVGGDLQDSDRYILAASEADEYSMEDPSTQNGIFTYEFLNVWNMSLDSNLDGTLTFQEIFPQLEINTASHSSSLGYTHHPQEFDGVGHNVSFKPSANITSLSVNGTNENVIDLNYNLIGLGEGKLLFSSYDVDNNLFTSSNENPIIAENHWGNIIYKDIDSGVDGVSSVLTAEYREFSDISNSNLQITPLQFNYSSDFDNDGSSDLEEFEKALNPWNNDTDGDGMGDGFEILYDLNPYIDDSMLDPDNDTLSNLLEFQIGTNPINSDSDEDGCPDGWEVNFSLDPTNQTDNQDDPDGDGLINILEYQNAGDPTEIDTDGDGLTDYQEYEIGTALNNTDTDGNGITDADEDNDGDSLSNIYEFQIGTDPQNTDSDDDGCPDGWEVNFGFEPTNQTDSQDDPDGDGLINSLEYQNAGNPTEIDTDNDGLTDFQEYEIGTALNNTDTDGNGITDADEDNDSDSLSNIYEFQIGTSPLNPDSDFDGCFDGWELNYGFDPLNTLDGLDDFDGDGLYNRLEYQNGGNPFEADTDGDGLTDYQEYEIGTTLNNSDTDGDGFSDQFEINMGTDPLDSSHTPLAREIFIGIFAVAPIFVIIYKKKEISRGKL